MRWRGRQGSQNIEDRRGSRGPRRAGSIGIVGIGIVLAVWALGGDPIQVLSVLSGGQGDGMPMPQAEHQARPKGELGQFASVVLRDTEITWSQLFQSRGQRYRAPKLVLFSNAVRSACGTQSSAVGPFYCPADQKAYIDLRFFSELERRFKAPGDFAQAYVLAHEVGHHIQNLVGTSDRVRQRQRGLPASQRNALSVRLELQADCYAGVWAHHAAKTRQLLEPGDVEEGLRAAAAIGDDTMQRRAGARVAPESFTHGTSEQRMRWLRRGMDQGTFEACDSFRDPKI